MIVPTAVMITIIITHLRILNYTVPKLQTERSETTEHREFTVTVIDYGKVRLEIYVSLVISKITHWYELLPIC